MAPQAPGNSTTIAGNVTDEVCLDRATFLIYDNYGREPANLEPESRQALAEVDTYWNREPGDFLFEDLDSGLYASLFTPKDGNQCPPTLVMRGTQFPDARGIVLAIRMTAAPSLAPNLQLPLDLAIAVESIKQAMPDFRTSESFWETAGIAASLVSTDVESLKTNGTWTEIFSARGVHMEGVTRIPLAFGPLRHIPGAEYALIVTLTARAEIWLNHNQGDWPANVLQGMGRRTDQYDSDLKNVAREVGPIVMERYDGNLRICGRSLGGGLTSAIALYLRENYPDMNIWGLTYDSSGLNHCTAERLGSSLSRASEVNIVARSVEDEILTSMQQRSDFVPVASSLIRFTGPRMPEALGTKDPRKGVSPGIMATMPRHRARPIPTRRNGRGCRTSTLLKRRISCRTSLMANSHSLQDFLDRLHGEIDRRVQEQRDTRYEAEQAERDAEEAAEAAEAEAEAAAEAAEAEAEAGAEAAEAEAEAAAEANEPGGFGGLLYDLYDEPRDALTGGADMVAEAADEVRELLSM